MITIDLENLVSLEKMFKTFPERTAEAARLAINQTAKREALSRVRQDMRKQINWKASYLNDPDKTGVAKYATKGSLVAAIYARDQPTMLNRFRPNPNTMPSKTTSGVKVKVKPTSTKVMKHENLVISAFLREQKAVVQHLLAALLTAVVAIFSLCVHGCCMRHP